MQADEVAAVIASTVGHWRADAISDICYLDSGYSNRNYSFVYDAQRYVIRIVTGSQPYVNRAAEQAWYQQLPPGTGVAPVAFDVRTGAMVTPWIEGELLVDTWSDATDAQTLVDFLLPLHARLPSPGRRYDVVALIEDHWDVRPFTVPPRPAVVAPAHNDLNPWNVIVTDERWVVLDWEFAGYNDPLFDLVCLHEGLGLPAGELENLAALLVRDSTDIADRLMQTVRLFWLRELGWARHQMALGNVRDEIEDQVALATGRLQEL